MSDQSLSQTSSPATQSKWHFLLLGPALALIPVFIDAPWGLSDPAWKLVGVTAWMVVWWISEAVPLPMTALLPLVAMPVFGITNQRAVGANYGDPLIFLFLCGFLIAAAMRRSNLHTRIALAIVSRVGSSVSGILAGFMLASAFLSMWISNTATTVMMFAVGVSIVDYVRGTQKEGANQAALRQFGVSLMLGIAYASSIGGIATLIGTAPNTLLASTVRNTYGVSIDMARWMMLCVPMSLVMLAGAWLWLRYKASSQGSISLDGAASVVREELAKLGPMSGPERRVLIVFALTALSWMFRPQIVSLTGLSLTDTSIGLIAALALFALPGKDGETLVTWDDSKEIPWGILLLFGGGLALAGAFATTGLAAAIGNSVTGLQGLNIWVIVLIVTALIVFLTELTSNTATSATFMPIMGAVATGMGENAMLLMIPVAIASSAAFMMPVATPPNAIVFAYQDIELKDMIRTGAVLNIMAIVVIVVAMYFLAPLVFNIQAGVPLTSLTQN